MLRRLTAIAVLVALTLTGSGAALHLHHIWEHSEHGDVGSLNDAHDHAGHHHCDHHHGAHDDSPSHSPTDESREPSSGDHHGCQTCDMLAGWVSLHDRDDSSAICGDALLARLTLFAESAPVLAFHAAPLSRGPPPAHF